MCDMISAGLEVQFKNTTLVSRMEMGEINICITVVSGTPLRDVEWNIIQTEQGTAGEC